ncbi:MAG: hypothetical protein ACI956_000948 [Nonlabens sp.]|jgi:hypothetical protein
MRILCQAPLHYYVDYSFSDVDYVIFIALKSMKLGAKTYPLRDIE